MANILKVAELRDELSKRGLTTTGIKATLVKRLESGIHTDINHRLGKKSRSEESEDGVLVKIRAVDDLRSLSVKQLREEAFLHGVSTGGSKKQLLERLCECSPRKKNQDVVEGADAQEDSVEVEGQYPKSGAGLIVKSPQKLLSTNLLQKKKMQIKRK